MYNLFIIFFYSHIYIQRDARVVTVPKILLESYGIYTYNSTEGMMILKYR
jgi:hypothetical protein